MTVKELKDALAVFDESKEVYLGGGENGQQALNTIKIESFNGYGPKIIELSHRDVT